MADEVKPGSQTTEFKLALIAQVLGIAGAILPPLWVFLTDVSKAFPEVRWIALGASVVGSLVTMLASLGYSKSRAAVKSAALSAVLALAVFAAPARAGDWGVFCVKGCVPVPEHALKLGMKAGATVAQKDGGADVAWWGPAVSSQLLQRDAGNAWSIAGSFALEYGFFYKPAFWSLTESLVSVNAGFGFSSGRVFSDQSQPFDINLVPTIGLFNILRVGYGPSVHLATGPTQKDGVTGKFYLGIGTNISSPFGG